MIRIFLFSLLCLSAGIELNAQIQKKILEHAKQLESAGNLRAACIYYKQTLEIDSSSAEVNFRYARCLHGINNYNKALHYYDQTQRLDRKRNFTEALHYKASVYKILGDYEKAFKYHRLFTRRNRGGRESYPYLKSKFETEHAQETRRLLKGNEAEVNLRNDYKVNTGFSEFSPFVIDKEHIVFNSLRSDSVSLKRVLDTASYYTRIYHSNYNQEWEHGILDSNIGTDEKVHFANIFYDSKRYYVYYNECDEYGRCDLYRARNDNGKWSDFLKLPEPINLPNYTSTQPSLARINGFDYLFFVSNRPGGQGKLDIWYTIAYSNGLFDEPVNLGELINSPGNEISPFYIDEENAMYFSSDWHIGLGGFDIFKSNYKTGSFEFPENVGKPFNSSYNDLYFRYNDGLGVLVSNRDGSKTDAFENCCNDLYFFSYESNDIQTESELNNLEKIERVLPLKLFFENDQPNPRSQDTSTTQLYSAGFINFKSALSKYQREYAKGMRGDAKEMAEDEIYDFFKSEIEPGYGDLKYALKLIENELQAGGKLEITIKGYASPLSNSDYNRKLTLRRIASIENELDHFNFGVLKKFKENGQLVVRKEPYGEDQISSEVSDDFNDKRNAIYSKQAMFERRVEIIKVVSVR